MKSYSLRILVILIMVGHCLCLSANTVDKEEAYEIVEEVLGDDIYDMDFFYSKAFIYDIEFDDPIFVLNDPEELNYHVFFIDEEPLKGWNHKCSYVYIPIDTERAISEDPYVRKEYDRPLITASDAFEPYMMNCSESNAISSYPVKPQIGTPITSAADSEHTYAIIISGGVTPIMNYERYWNDCSYLFRVLKGKYLIPDENITVIMADGTDPGKDMRKYDGTGFVSSPLDLDGDGINDIKYAATRQNVAAAILELATKVERGDQVLIYVMDHGGYDSEKDESYICLWNDESIYASEFSSLTNFFDDDIFRTIVLGQCFSGGFIKHLSESSNVIATACGENESSWACKYLPYDEFVFQWTNAINMRHGVDGSYINPEINNDGKVSMYEAFKYAEAKDQRVPLETQMYSSRCQSVGEELAMDNVPSIYSLYVRDDTDDTGLEPNDVYNFWDSPDIWVRNQNDGLLHQESEPIAVAENAEEKIVHIYMRIHNRGIEDYMKSMKKRFYHLYFANASLGILPQNWLGIRCDNEEHIYGGGIETNSVTTDIGSGSSSIIHTSWSLPADLIEEVHGGYLHFCLLGRLSSSRGEEIPEKDLLLKYMSDVPASNRLAQKNLSFIISSDPKSNNIPLRFRSLSDTDHQYNIEILADDASQQVFKEAEISVTLSDNMYEAWEETGKNGNNLKLYSDMPQTVYMQENGVISNITAGATDVMNVKCDFLSDYGIRASTDTFKINIVQRDAETGKIVGGECIYIIREPDTAPLEPKIEIEEGEITSELTANNIAEPASFDWYDKDNNHIGSGKTVPLPTSVSGEITLRTVAEKSGRIAYASTFVEPKQAIKSVAIANNNTAIKLVLASLAPKGTLVRIAKVSNGTSSEYIIREGEKEVTITPDNFDRGVYVISLVVDGATIESKSIVKK